MLPNRNCAVRCSFASCKHPRAVPSNTKASRFRRLGTRLQAYQNHPVLLKTYSRERVHLRFLQYCFQKWEEQKSHPLFTEWDEKWDNMNTLANSFEVWIKKVMKPWGQGYRKRSHYFIIFSHSSSAFLCLLHVSNHKLDSKSMIKVAMPRKRFLQTMLNSQM